MQMQNAVPAYLNSKQLLHFAFAQQSSLYIQVPSQIIFKTGTLVSKDNHHVHNDIFVLFSYIDNEGCRHRKYDSDSDS